MASSAVERPRFTTWKPWDHQPGLWIVTILSLTYASLTFILRHLVRRKFTRTDATLCVAYILGLTSYGLMFAALHHGAGKAPERLSSDSYIVASKVSNYPCHAHKHSNAKPQQLVYAAIIFLLLACGTANSASLCMLEEIVISRKDKIICWASLALSACITILCPVLVSAGCADSQILDARPTRCNKPVARWSATIALMVVNLLLSALLPFYLFRMLYTKVNRKIGIYIAFAFPLISIPIAALALRLYVRFAHSGNDGTDIVSFLCAMEVLLGWALICVTIPIGRPMALRFHTNGTLVLTEYGSSNMSSGRNGKPISEHRSKRRPPMPLDNEFHVDRFLHFPSGRRSSGARTDPEISSFGIQVRTTVTREVETVDPISFIMKQ